MVSGESFKLKSQVVRAGAGTGKTTCLVDEVFTVYKYFKEKKDHDPNLVVCTFTIKATQELRERLYQKAIALKNWDFLDYIQSSSLHISTIDSILSLFLRTYAYKYELNPDFNLEDAQKENKLFNELSEKYFFGEYSHLLERMQFGDLQTVLRFYIKTKLKYGEVSFFDKSDFEEFNLEKENYESQNLSLDCKEEIKKMSKESECLEGKHFVSFFKDFKVMADEFFTEYLTQKKIQGCLVIDDLALFSLDLLRKSSQVARSFSKEWDYWFIDEYQDTSWVQEQIIKHITGFKNVFCVGDPKQSIYFFRGADPHVFKRRIDSLGQKVRNLGINYRSNSSLIHFFNDFFTEEDGFITFQPSKDKKCNIEKPCVHFLTYDKDQEESFESTYHYIQKLLEEGNRLNDIAILSRRNSDLLSLVSFLKKKNINVLLNGSNCFADNRLILDALFLFKFLINPYDNTNLISLCRTPYFYLTDQKIADFCYEHNQFCKKETNISLWSYLEEHYLKENVIQQLKEYLEIEKNKGLLKTFEQALLEKSFLDLSHYQDSSGSSESNLWKLLFLLHNTSDPLDLFYSVMMEEESDSSISEVASFLNSDAIQLMTIHKSKGLEFKHVILFDLSIGSSQKESGNKDCVFDIQKRKMAFSVPVGNRNKKKIRSYGHKKIVNQIKRQELEERDRLFYVAMTRAKESLTFLLPSKKIEKSSWLHNISFFKTFVDVTYKDNNPKRGIQVWSLKEDFYRRDNYSFVVQHQFKFSPKKELSETPVNPIPPYKDKFFEKNYIKSSKDFQLDVKEQNHSQETQLNVKGQNHSQETQLNVKEQNHSQETQLNVKGQGGVQQKIIIPRVKNTIFTMNVGSHLHSYLRMLSKHPLESVLSQLDYSYLSEKDKAKIQEGLKYISYLENPDFKSFFKNGESEWSFKFKKENVILQGRIDLWGKKNGNEIWVFDYKSAPSQSVKKQLIFYSWILENMYQPETITMCEVYPFEKRIESQNYKEIHKKEMENWLKSFV